MRIVRGVVFRSQSSRRNSRLSPKGIRDEVSYDRPLAQDAPLILGEPTTMTIQLPTMALSFSD